MLLHTGGRRTSSLRDDASRLWYPLWDAGFVLGHSVRTVKEALSLADSELDALTALLDTRLLAGDDELLDEMMAKVRRLAPKRRNRLIDELSEGAAERLRQPGPIAEMLAPNLKDGGGGLRDVQAPGWIGWALGPDPGGPGATPGAGGWSTGVATLVALGYLPRRGPHPLARGARPPARRPGRAPPRDRRAFRPAHAPGPGRRRPSGRRRRRRRRSSAISGSPPALVVWIASDLWARLLALRNGPGGRSAGMRSLGDGIVAPRQPRRARARRRPRRAPRAPARRARRRAAAADRSRPRSPASAICASSTGLPRHAMPSWISSRRAAARFLSSKRSTTSVCSCACCRSGSTCAPARSGTRTTGSPSIVIRSRRWRRRRRSAGPTVSTATLRVAARDGICCS